MTEAASSNADNTTVHVLCGFDEGYAMPAAVTLRSIARTLRPGERCIAHVVGIRLDPTTRERIDGLADGALEIRWRDFDETWLDSVPLRARPGPDGAMVWLNDTVFIRLFLDRFLPEDVHRVVFLDVDTVVASSLVDLWEIDLDGAVLGGVRDGTVPTISVPRGLNAWVRLGLDGRLPYLNAGVLLIDRVAWRAASVEHLALDYLVTNADEIRYFDQDALNAVLAGRMLELPTHWNAQISMLEKAVQDDAARIWSFIERGEIEAALRTPSILHFAGPDKPWSAGGAAIALADRWYAVVDETPWAGCRPGPVAPAPPWARLRRAGTRIALTARVLRRGNLG